MARPIVAVVGRPNVGKSTLVNRLCEERSAIVHESRGVTRDRSYHEADWAGRDFIVIDTGGVESQKSDDPFALSIRNQALAACDEADVIVFVVDGSVAPTDEDEEVARVLKRTKKPVFLVVNKLDDPDKDLALWDYYNLGVGQPLPISAVHGHGTGDLLDDIVAVLPEETEAPEQYQGSIGVAIVGRPNVGKSSLLNRLLGEERAIVSDVSGTTRDAIDALIEHADTTIRLIDTAGMRKRAKLVEDVEYYSTVRGLQALDEADVALLVVDASVGVTEQDQKVAGMAIERGCALAVLLNKWDLLEEEEQRTSCLESLSARMTFAGWAPILRISAKTGRSVQKVLDLALSAYGAYSSRVSTHELNTLISRLRETGHTVTDNKRRLKIHYATQVATQPPTFAFFCNAPDLVDDNFERYLENRLRENFDFMGTPLRLRFRNKD